MGKSQIDDLLDVMVVNTVKYHEGATLEEKAIIDLSYKNKIIRDLQVQAVKEVLLQKFKSHYSRLIDEGDADEIIPLFKELRDKQEEKFKSDFVFMTVNPRLDIPIFDFLKLLPKMVNRVWIKKYLYVVEQRSEDLENLGKGFHLHCLFNKGDYRLSHLKRDMVSVFKKVCDVDNPSCLNIKLVKENDLKNYHKYMLCRKADPVKWLKQDMDIEFRKKYNILNYYGEFFIDFNEENETDAG